MSLKHIIMFAAAPVALAAVASPAAAQGIPVFDSSSYLQALAFKAIRSLWPDYPIWRDFPYEYVFDRLAIDVINGGPALREWVDDAAAAPGDLEGLASADETRWTEERQRFLLYP